MAAMDTLVRLIREEEKFLELNGWHTIDGTLSWRAPEKIFNYCFGPNAPHVKNVFQRAGAVNSTRNYIVQEQQKENRRTG